MSTSNIDLRFFLRVQHVIQDSDAGCSQVRLFSETDFLAKPQRETFGVFGQTNVVAKNKKRIFGELNALNVFSAFFQNKDTVAFGFLF